MSEEEAAAKLAAVLNEIESAGHDLDVLDWYITVGSATVRPDVNGSSWVRKALWAVNP